MNIGASSQPSASLVDALFEGARIGEVNPHDLPFTTVSLAEGLAAQLAVLGRWEDFGERLGGWKVGLTSGTARDSMGPGFRPHGYILASRVLESADSRSSAECRLDQVEVELCIEIGRPISGTDLDDAILVEAVAGMRPALELNQHRLPRPIDPGLQIADDLSQWGIVIGELRPWPPPTLLEARLELDGETVAQTESGLEIDPPLVALRRLCDRLAASGRGLKPGHQVMTGALTKAAVRRPGRWQGSVVGLGTVAFELT